MKYLPHKICFKTLIILSKLVIKKYQPKIIAVTGSVGKSSTKEAIYTALSRVLSIRKSLDGERSELTAALAIIGREAPNKDMSKWLSILLEGMKLWLLPNHYPEWLVVSVGGDRPGDIENLCKWLKPDVVVVTRFDRVPVHVEFFPSREALLMDKSCLVSALKKEGKLILNADDKEVLALADNSLVKPILFGKSKEADVRILDAKLLAPEGNLPMGVVFHIQAGVEEAEVPLRGTVGEHNGYSLAAAFAVLLALGENISSGAKSFLYHEPAKGRMRIREGINDAFIIDDSFNSSPVAVEEALKTFKKLTKIKRKIAVLGDMFELGRFSIDEHRKMGVEASKVADILILVGVRSRYAAESALETGMEKENILVFDGPKEAGKYLEENIKKGDAVLVKGSREMQMEKTVEMILT